MISDLIKRFIARPIVAAVTPILNRVKLEPVAVAGGLVTAVTFFRDQLAGGADLETALTASILLLGTWVVRSNVWPSVKIDAATGTPEEPLGDPITGLDSLDD